MKVDGIISKGVSLSRPLVVRATTKTSTVREVPPIVVIQRPNSEVIYKFDAVVQSQNSEDVVYRFDQMQALENASYTFIPGHRTEPQTNQNQKKIEDN
jgi:hypothetical protein